MRMVKWVCAKEGRRELKYVEFADRARKPRAETRVDCPAHLRVKKDDTNKKWVVADFVSDHNHALVDDEHVHFIPCHRDIDGIQRTQADAMHSAGIKTSQVVDYFAQQHGGYSKMGFIGKDMYNYKSRTKKQSKLCDAQQTLGFLSAQQEMNKAFYYDYRLTDNNELGSFFWADAISRADYALFGDVLAFDAAYRRNKYNNPIVTFVGVDNHHISIVFGCAIVGDETVDTYTWLLKTFLKCMGDKQPLTIVTDGDRAMRAAVRGVVPTSTHRLCQWHIQRNVTRMFKDPDLCRSFRQCMNDRLEIVEFEKKWGALVDRHKLHEVEWASKMYADKQLWAEAYLKDRFSGGIRTTSRCEGMHSYMNKFLHRRLDFMESVKHFQRGLEKIRQSIALGEYLSEYGVPVCLHTLHAFEAQAAGIYTPKSFRFFQRELHAENGYVNAQPVIDDDNCRTYTLCWWQRPAKTRIVVFDVATLDIMCSCKLFESTGFPCRHMLNVMKQEALASIPNHFFHVRWTKKARHALSDMSPNVGNLSDEVVCSCRAGALYAQFSGLADRACTSSEAFEELSAELKRLSERVDVLITSKSCLASSKFAAVQTPITRGCKRANVVVDGRGKKKGGVLSVGKVVTQGQNAHYY